MAGYYKEELASIHDVDRIELALKSWKSWREATCATV